MGIGVILSAGWLLFGRAGSKAAPARVGTHVLFYVDPMNPAHTSEKPGKAPCGMDMVPVYSDEHSQSGGQKSAIEPVGRGLRISAEKQQLLGIKTAVVEQRAAPRLLRLLGKVAVDETRLYRVSAPVNGWITEAHAFATGDPVKKNQVLATYYSPQLATTAQSLLYAVNTRGRLQRNRQDADAENSDKVQENLHLQQFVDSLKNLGMEDAQISTMITNRKQAANVEILAPAEGHILSRNLTLGQRFERGTEFFQIADLSHVWILADVLEDEAERLTPGLQVAVTAPNLRKKWTATVSGALPRFDSVARRLQVRLEVDNPGLTLRPDMFVDLDVPVSVSESISIPADSVLDSGLEKVVFVDAGGGSFEPRSIVIGSREVDQVIVAEGLKPGERVVVGGNFLLDSESRMKFAARNASSVSLQPGMTPHVAGAASARDVVCGMELKAGTGEFQSHLAGTSFYFCSLECKQRFDKDPSMFRAAKQAGSSGP